MALLVIDVAVAAIWAATAGAAAMTEGEAATPDAAAATCAATTGEAFITAGDEAIWAAAAAKKAGRETNQGLIHSYIHMGGKIGVLIEVNCETDFVARNEEFKAFVNDLALQVAAAKPSFVKREDVPADVAEKEKTIYEGQAKEMGKPPAAWPKIVEGKLEKFYQESCLLEQSFIKDPAVTIKDLLAQKIAKIGENMNVRRFTRYQLGEA